MIFDARRTARRTASRTSAALVVGVLLLAGCTAPAKQQSPVVGSSAGPAAEQAPDGFEKYYGQTLEWSDCKDGLECATASAPASWQDAGSDVVELALVRNLAAGKDRVGSLLVNPGGPGGSGVDFVRAGAQDGSRFGKKLHDAFDIIGFDPRGVKASTRVECLDDAAKDEALSKDYDRSTDAGLKAMGEGYEAWNEACAEHTGEVLGHVDTQSVARDMDMLRAVLGDEELNYLGYSYGTQLGATYAGLFPDRAGRLVLDGAIDTTLPADELSRGQAVGFENALRAYVKDCQAGADCPLTGDVDEGLGQVRQVLDQAYESPYPTGDPDGRRLTQNSAFYGIALTLYNQGDWTYLTDALDQIITQGDGSMLLSFADQYNDRQADGTYSSNSEEAFRAVGCLDDRGTTDVKKMRAEAAETEKAAPTVGTFFTYGGLVCEGSKYPVVKQEFDLHAKGAPPIVVIGTTNDPATPYVWAEGLAKTLDSGVLVTYQGEGHTAYQPSRTCVADVVESYLVDGDVPGEGTTC